MAALPPEIQARIERARGAVASFDEALARAKEESRAKRLHLRHWLPHQADPTFYYRQTPDGSFEVRPEKVLQSRWPAVDQCESPVEVYLYNELVGEDIFGWHMLAQHEVNCGALYRLDFAFLYWLGRQDGTPFIHKQVCVEIDGHEYHERTKEQAQYDKQRDRRLTLAGWRVLRFTGSEVFRDARACADEVRAHLRGVLLG